MAFRTDNLECKVPVPSDLEAAQAVKPLYVKEIAEGLGLDLDTDVELYGNFKAKVKLSVLDKFKDKKEGKFVVVAGVTPTPLGEGKTTTTVGVSQALGRHLSKSVFTTVRQPSMGPTFGLKGGAAGGGYSQVIPMDEFNLHLTGDLHAVSISHNLLCGALDQRMFHEATQSDAALFDRLAPKDKDGVPQVSHILEKRFKKKGVPTDPGSLKSLSPEQIRAVSRLDIDPSTINLRRVVDVNDRFLRSVEIGKGDQEGGLIFRSMAKKRAEAEKISKGDAEGDAESLLKAAEAQKGVAPRESGFDIAVASEVMAILALSSSLQDLRDRLGRMVVASDRSGEAVTVEDLGCAGAMTVLLKDAMKPTLMQTLEGTPVFVHAGPFANIAHGNSSVVADKIALKLVGEEGIVITEAGFGADVGFEKCCDIKCRDSGLKPDAAVIVATVRALKLHGGAPKVVAGQVLAPVYSTEALDVLEKGCANLMAHVRNVRKFGIPAVVCVNQRNTDTPAELELVRVMAKKAGAFDAVVSNHWAKGGEGAVDLAKAVAAAAFAPKEGEGFRFIYPLDLSIREKILKVATEIYSASGVNFSDIAEQQIARYEALGLGHLCVCNAKTQYSISTDPELRGDPQGHVVSVREVRLSAGAGFVVPILGPVMTMPGLPTRPAFYDIDLILSDAEPEGKIVGLF